MSPGYLFSFITLSQQGFRSTAWPNVCASVCSHSITYFTPGQGYPTPPSIFLRGQGSAYNSQQTSGGNKVSLSTRRNVSRFIPLTSHSLNQMNFLLLSSPEVFDFKASPFNHSYSCDLCVCHGESGEAWEWLLWLGICISLYSVMWLTCAKWLWCIFYRSLKVKFRQLIHLVCSLGKLFFFFFSNADNHRIWSKPAVKWTIAGRNLILTSIHIKMSNKVLCILTEMILKPRFVH